MKLSNSHILALSVVLGPTSFVLLYFGAPCFASIIAGDGHRVLPAPALLQEIQWRANAGDIEFLETTLWSTEDFQVARAAQEGLAQNLTGPRRHDADAALLRAFRLHPHWSILNLGRGCERTADAGPRERAPTVCGAHLWYWLSETPLPRLLFSEACGSLGLRYLESPPDVDPYVYHCLYPDNTIADDDLQALLFMREHRVLPKVLDSSTVPAIPIPRRPVRRLAPEDLQLRSGEYVVREGLSVYDLSDEELAYWKPFLLHRLHRSRAIQEKYGPSYTFDVSLKRVGPEPD